MNLCSPKRFCFHRFRASPCVGNTPQPVRERILHRLKETIRVTINTLLKKHPLYGMTYNPSQKSLDTPQKKALPRCLLSMLLQCCRLFFQYFFETAKQQLAGGMGEKEDAAQGFYLRLKHLPPCTAIIICLLWTDRITEKLHFGTNRPTEQHTDRPTDNNLISCSCAEKYCYKTATYKDR